MVNGYNLIVRVVPAATELEFAKLMQTISFANPAPVVTVKAALFNEPESPVLALHVPEIAVGDGKEDTAEGLPARVVS